MRILFAIAACSLAVLISSSNSYPQPQPKSENKPTAEDKRGTQESPLIIQGNVTTKATEKSESDRQQEQIKIEIEGSLAKYTGVAAVATGLLVVVTAVLAGFTYNLWRSTNKLVGGAEDTTQRQLRAYVMVKRTQIVKDPTRWSTPNTPGIYLSIKNFGHIPATDIECSYAVCVKDMPLNMPLDGARDPVMNGVIAPGDTWTLQFEGPLIISGLNDTHAALYVHGAVRYRDGFSHDKRVTYFRFMRKGGGNWNRDGEIETHPDGNSIA